MASSKFEIEKSEDFKSIAEFLRQNFKNHNLKFDEKYVNISLNSGLWLIAKNKETVLGTLFLKVIKSDSRGEIKHLLVRKEHRRNGIARSVLNESINLAKKMRLRKLTGFGSSRDIGVVKKLASSFGCKLEGILKDHYRAGEDCYVYSKFLD